MQLHSFSLLISKNRYAATWGTVAFLVPTEIFPSDLRAQGNGFGITGWAIGVGMTTLVNPIMFRVMTVGYLYQLFCPHSLLTFLLRAAHISYSLDLTSFGSRLSTSVRFD
jgi:hypothetical protein